MAFKVYDSLPPNCALRRGTLIAGVTRPARSDPMQPAIDQIERALRAKALSVQAMYDAEQAASTTRKPSENT